jgi:hypothetical protein
VATKAPKKKKQQAKAIYVQGAYLQVDDRSFMEIEARQAGFRSATQLATSILRKWIDDKKVIRAHEIIREAQNGKEETAAGSIGAGQAASQVS